MNQVKPSHSTAKPMLIGEFKHTIDDKKRISIPANFRKEIGRKVVITRGLDNCLFLYTPEGWKKAIEQLSAMSMLQAASRGFDRFIFGGAFEAEIDTMGRVLIPDHLRDFADLKSKVVIVGLNNRIEIWDEKKWKDHIDKVEKQADVLAENLMNVGIL